MEEDTKECIIIDMASRRGYIDDNYEERGIKCYVGEMSLALYNPSEMYKIESIGKHRELNLQLILDRNMPFYLDSSSIFTISDNKRIQKISLDSISPNYWDGKKFPIEIDIKHIDKIKEIYFCQLFLFLDRKIEYKFKCCFNLIDI